jgi:O-antigen/teichoic acid export membrane protein
VRLRNYLAFSWPLFLVNLSVLVMVQATYFFGNDAVGLAGAGAIALSATISQFSLQVDQIVSGTMYPVICAIQARVDLLRESFVKSNRVALMWAVPFGLGLSLFASDLVKFGIGERWHQAIPLLVVFGAFAAIGHFGFNWDDYFRARGQTRPMAWAAVITTVSFLMAAIPLVYVWGVKGLAVAVAVQTVVNLCCRVYFLRRLFAGFEMLRHAARASAPAVPAAVAVLLVRLLETGPRTSSKAVLEIALYAVLVIVATWMFERGLVAEMLGYLRVRT